jgi:hypothetical protein
VKQQNTLKGEFNWNTGSLMPSVLVSVHASDGLSVQVPSRRLSICFPVRHCLQSLKLDAASFILQRQNDLHGQLSHKGQQHFAGVILEG